VGASLGGMISQHVAATHSERVSSLTLIMTTSGSRRLPGPTAAARRALLSQPANKEPETLIAHSMNVFLTIGSPGYLPTPTELRERVAASIARASRPAGSARQLLAIAADGDRTPMLARIQAPTQVIHGVVDPLVPVANGRDLMTRIPGALGDFIEGMGHDLPRALLGRIAQGIATNAQRAG
jgi:pimeloyl-ACP methyl ester carboxylesterase